MHLKELIKKIEVIEVSGSLDVPVKGIAYHTKDVEKGFCFVAISGNQADGHNYVDKAIANGATVVVTSKRTEVPNGIANVVVTSPRMALAVMSAALYKEPSKSMTLVGVTGTNGKTTITYLLESIWQAGGHHAGVVGTVNYRYGDVLTNPKHTTPESSELQKIFADMLKSGVDSVAMEVSSHAIDQCRVYGCDFDGAIFTNLTQDHLDYHLDMTRYREVKARLFNYHLPQSSKKGKWAVINVDDPVGADIAKELNYRVYAYSLSKKVDVYAEDLNFEMSGLGMTVVLADRSFRIESALIGRHNASNILAAVSASVAMGIDVATIKKGVEALKCVPGRLEPVLNTKGLTVLVDYAHTPDAIRNVTTALKGLKPERLITVFGCGGDRDKTKRPMMGFEAALRSDVLIVTSDNPRSEDPKKIVDEIVTGVTKIGLEANRNEGGYFVEIDRKKAIQRAITMAGPKDIVLIAGKGHEDYQIIGNERISFDDRKVAEEAMESL